MKLKGIFFVGLVDAAKTILPLKTPLNGCTYAKAGCASSKIGYVMVTKTVLTEMMKMGVRPDYGTVTHYIPDLLVRNFDIARIARGEGGGGVELVSQIIHRFS